MEQLPLQPIPQKVQNMLPALPNSKEAVTRPVRKGSAKVAPSTTVGEGTLLSSSGKLKRTFKEKFLAEVSAAEAKAAARQQVIIHDRKQLCIDTLAEGRPQAFIDLFNLTHARVASSSKAGPSSRSPDQEQPDDEVAPESLGFLRDNLVIAEASARRGDQGAIYNVYNSLAKYFEAIENHSKSLFFYQKCLEVAKAAQLLEGELEANHNLGVAEERARHLENAIAFHERHLALAITAENEDEQNLASHNLVQVYRKMAEQMESKGKLEQAVDFLQKCLRTAQAGHDRAAEGLAFYQLGLAYEKMGQPQTAIICHNNYRDLCREAGDKAGEGTASCALAQAHKDLGDVAAAIADLENFLELAKNGDPASQARACCSLGVIHHQQQKYDRAVTYFDKFFEIARASNDRQMLEIARVNLGVARASLQMDKYMEVVSFDLPTLILWKNARTPLVKGEGQ